MKKIAFLTVTAALMIFAASCGQNAPKQSTEEPATIAMDDEDSDDTQYSGALRPSEISEFANPGYNTEDDSYPFVHDPDGKYYHFKMCVSYGDSPWFGLRYGEHFTASSSLNNNYSADKLTNEILLDYQPAGGVRNTAWCEGAGNYGIGEWVNMSIFTKSYFESKSESVCIRELMIVNGNAKDATTWKNYSRVKTLRLYLGDTHWCDLHLNNVIKPQIFDLGTVGWIYPANLGTIVQYPEWDIETPEIPTYQIDLKFEILEVYPGDKYDNTCITGIAVAAYGEIY
jgi:hypothetical protein